MKSRYKLGDTFKQGELTYMVIDFDAQGRAISAVRTEKEIKDAKKELKETAKKEAEKQSEKQAENAEDNAEKLPVGEKEDTETDKEKDGE